MTLMHTVCGEYSVLELFSGLWRHLAAGESRFSLISVIQNSEPQQTTKGTVEGYIHNINHG